MRFGAAHAYVVLTSFVALAVGCAGIGKAPAKTEIIQTALSQSARRAPAPPIKTVSYESSTPGVPPVPVELDESALAKSSNSNETVLRRDERVSLAQYELDAPSDDLSDVPPAIAPLPQGEEYIYSPEVDESPNSQSVYSDAIPLNLPTALSMVGGRHPAVGFAQWRVQEAYAQLDQAKVLWLPSIQPGFSFHRHDGNYQASDGSIVDVNRNSFQYGLGAAATGAGTTPLPGVVARFHFADAIFQPHIAEKTAWARGHAAKAVVNEQLLRVAITYFDLLAAAQDLSILEDTRSQTAGLAKITADFAASGEGLQADADRMQTELSLVEDRLASGREQVEVASARLAQTLSIHTGQRITPLDMTVLPIDLVTPAADRAELIGTGLRCRPELKEAQALVAAACQQYRRQKYAPFVPSVLLGFSTGGFGGGLADDLDNIDSRYDFDAVVTWQVRNMGFGEKAFRRESIARLEQAKYEKIRALDQVALEISEAHAQVTHRAERLQITQSAVRSAEDSYERNLSRIREGSGLPLEVLQSVQALEDARRAYLKSVVEFNQAQFRLQWSLGWSIKSSVAMSL